MDITPFVGSFRRDLLTAAEGGGEQVRAAADRLVTGLDPAMRLTLLDVLSQAASDVTGQLDGTTVEVRLRGREPVFVALETATQRPMTADTHATEQFGSDESDGVFASGGFDDLDSPGGDEPVSRITLRLPESLKSRAEEMAAQRGQSLNTWLVNAARLALSAGLNAGPDLGRGPFGWGQFGPGHFSGLDIRSIPFGPGAPGRNRSSNKRMQGWVR